MSFRTMTIGDLCVSPFNVRMNQVDANSIQGMAESLLARGQLYPLVVHPMPKTKGKPEQWGALAGGRRYRAFKMLIDDGRLPADYPIEVIVRDGMDEAQLVELSLAENLVRVELRPYEVYAAVSRAHQRGRTLKEIAETNGQTVETVRRWARLGNLEPSIFRALEMGDIDQAQAKAYAATEDHALQRHVFETVQRIPGSSWQRAPDIIRRMLKFGDSELRKLLRFVGEGVYREAGGRYEMDLFAEDAEERGRIVDEGLLVQLADAKMEATRAKLRTQAGRDLRFASEYPRDSQYGGFATDLEIGGALLPLDADAQARVTFLKEEMAELEFRAEQLLDLPDTAERAAAIAAIDVDYVPMEKELADLEAQQRLLLPDGDIFGTLIVEPDGELEIRWWWASRKAKRAADGGKETKRPASVGPIPKAAAAAALQAARPAPVPGGKAIDSTYHFQDRQRADAALKIDAGLTADGVQAMRSLRREMLRAAMLDAAQQGGSIAEDYLVWSLLRRELVGGYDHEIGSRALSPASRDLPGAVAATLLAQTEANRRWKAALEAMRSHACMAENDPVPAFRAYRAEDEPFRRTASAILAGLSLVRSANADGYRVPLHDLLAESCRFSDPARLRTLIEPTEELVDLFPKAQRLAFAQPHVDASAFRSWDKLKAAELLAPVARALKRAKAWVHPMLQFAPPPLPTPALQSTTAKSGQKSRKPETQKPRTKEAAA